MKQSVSNLNTLEQLQGEVTRMDDADIDKSEVEDITSQIQREYRQDQKEMNRMLDSHLDIKVNEAGIEILRSAVA